MDPDTREVFMGGERGMKEGV